MGIREWFLRPVLSRLNRLTNIERIDMSNLSDALTSIKTKLDDQGTKLTDLKTRIDAIVAKGADGVTQADMDALAAISTEIDDHNTEVTQFAADTVAPAVEEANANA